MPTVQCPKCGAKLNVTEKALGKSGRCPKCQEKFLVEIPMSPGGAELDPFSSPPGDVFDPLSSPLTDSADPLGSAGFDPLSAPFSGSSDPLAPASAPRPVLASANAPRPMGAAASPAFMGPRGVKAPVVSAPNQRPAWLIPAVIGGASLAVAGLGVLVVAGVLFLWLGRGKGDVADGADGQNALGSSSGAGVVLPPRKATSGENSTVSAVAVPPVDAATWKATADGFPLTKELKSLIPLDTVRLAALCFPRPDLAEAAVVESVFRPADTAGVFDWVRCDLRQDKPVARIHLWQEEAPRAELLQRGDGNIPMPWSVSPSGKRLATARGGTAWVFASDGTRVANFIIKGADNQVPWLGFAGEDSLWIRWKNELRQYSLPGGEMVRKLDSALLSSPSFTPGNKYLLLVSKAGLEVLVAADGSRAGTLPFPDGYGTFLEPAVNPDGTKVAVALADQRANALIVVWDLATGNNELAISQPYARVQRRLVENRLAWVGDDLLYVGRIYFHLGLGEIIADEKWEGGLAVGPSPDGRLWQIRSFNEPQQATQLGDLAKSDSNNPKQLLCAASMPPPSVQSVVKSTGGFAWRPGIAVSGVVHGVPKKHATAVAAGLSDRLAREGLSVDPDAKIKIELTITREADGEMAGKDIPKDKLTAAMRDYIRTHPHEKWVELVPVKNLVVKGTVYNAEGKPAFNVPTWLVSRAIDKGGNDDPVWQALTLWQDGFKLPKSFFRDETGKRVSLPAKYIVPGVDGLVDALIEPINAPAFSVDEFKLPGEAVETK